MILGIDVSTSITGFAIVGDDEILHYSMCDLRKHIGPFAKAEAVKGYIVELNQPTISGGKDEISKNYCKKEWQDLGICDQSA